MAAPDVVCFSHLRWNFVFQRPQHLMTRYVHQARVFFFEEPVHDADSPVLRVLDVEGGVRVLTPHLPAGLSGERADAAQRELLERFVERERIAAPLLWFYTPMAVGLSSNLEPSLVVYDCMDELSAFLAAPPALQHREAELFRRADIVFTGGHSLYEAKRGRHPNVHAFPSSVDTEHFQSARRPAPEDAERKGGRPARVGYFGVLDERLDVPLLDGVASACPDIEMVLVGPVVKIDPATLPKRPNLHYLGPKLYSELPSIIASWDAAMMPFARNDATRFISPTKTLEYMAAGKPIVSTSIRDVVRPYGEQGLVRIADDATSFARAIAEALSEDTSARLAAFDAFLAHTSWDRTWRGMRSLIDAAFAARGKARRRGCRLETA